MTESLTEFRKLLGATANGLTDAEVEDIRALEYSVADNLLAWYEKRRGTPIDSFTGAYDMDVDEMVRRDSEKMELKPWPQEMQKPNEKSD